jgi:hypothetical protein
VELQLYTHAITVGDHRFACGPVDRERSGATCPAHIGILWIGQRVALSVSFPAGHVVDPNGDLNPDTVEVTR